METDAGKNELIQVARELELLATKNPCGWSDEIMMMIARSIRAIMHSKPGIRFSYTDISRIFGVSCKTIRRRVQSGELPKPQHYGHHDVSFRAEDVDQYINNRKHS